MAASYLIKYKPKCVHLTLWRNYSLFYGSQRPDRYLVLTKDLLCHQNLQQRINLSGTASISSEEGYFTKLKKKLHFHFFMKSMIESKACSLYALLDTKVDVENFFKVCKLPDTFYSWYVVMELHVWMLCARVMAENEQNGRLIRETLLRSFWSDIEARAKKLDVSASKRNKQVQELIDHYLYTFLSYDEALGGNDKILASALWHILLSKNCDDMETIETCVSYVRKNIAALDSASFVELVFNGNFKFLPLSKPSEFGD